MYQCFNFKGSGKIQMEEEGEKISVVHLNDTELYKQNEIMRSQSEKS